VDQVASISSIELTWVPPMTQEISICKSRDTERKRKKKKHFFWLFVCLFEETGMCGRGLPPDKAS
jgi:hypothetical protein